MHGLAIRPSNAQSPVVTSELHPNLRVILSTRNVSYREADRPIIDKLPLLISLTDLSAEAVVIGGPDRPRWPVDVVGIECGGHRGLRRCHQLSTPDTLTEAGIVVGGVKETIMCRATVSRAVVLSRSRELRQGVAGDGVRLSHAPAPVCGLRARQNWGVEVGRRSHLPPTSGAPGLSSTTSGAVPHARTALRVAGGVWVPDEWCGRWCARSRVHVSRHRPGQSCRRPAGVRGR